MVVLDATLRVDCIFVALVTDSVDASVVAPVTAVVHPTTRLPPLAPFVSVRPPSDTTSPPAATVVLDATLRVDCIFVALVTDSVDASAVAPVTAVVPPTTRLPPLAPAVRVRPPSD